MFTSTFCYRGNVNLPKLTDTRIMMMPIIIGDLESVPDSLDHYKGLVSDLFDMAGHKGKVGYLTIDEKHLSPGITHRREGLHVDGMYHGKIGAWGGGGSWGSVGNGMLTVSSHAACKAWNQSFEGMPGDEGECDHLLGQCKDLNSKIFASGEVYWLDGLCVHESIPVTQNIDRQFIRLSLPSNGPWFEGYTANPLGVLPSAEILPRREFMNS